MSQQRYNVICRRQPAERQESRNRYEGSCGKQRRAAGKDGPNSGRAGAEHRPYSGRRHWNPKRIGYLPGRPDDGDRFRAVVGAA